MNGGTFQMTRQTRWQAAVVIGSTAHKKFTPAPLRVGGHGNAASGRFAASFCSPPTHFHFSARLEWAHELHGSITSETKKKVCFKIVQIYSSMIQI